VSALSLAGFARHRVLAVGVAFPAALERLAPFFDVQVAAEPLSRDPDTLVERLAGKSALLASSPRSASDATRGSRATC